jgi:hypothetical protein
LDWTNFLDPMNFLEGIVNVFPPFFYW